MQKNFPVIWISSVEHLVAFSALAKMNPWWKLLLGINKVPGDFPYVKIGSRKYPLVCFSEGSLDLYERELKYKANWHPSTIKNEYFNLKRELSFEFEYNSIKVSRFKHPKPFMKAFNIDWVKLTLPGNYGSDHILLSVGGSGIKLSQITKPNDEIFEFLKNKINTGK